MTRTDDLIHRWASHRSRPTSPASAPSCKTSSKPPKTKVASSSIAECVPSKTPSLNSPTTWWNSAPNPVVNVSTNAIASSVSPHS
ncbi:hypothetical protein FRB95_005665 [Tulasnella sp. JGI-2019a]|nr:hypothetical protein FRB95_005665 [Tulasnella sp. JGI-2019a]